MTTGSQIEVVTRFVRKGDEDRIVELLQAAFDGWPKYDIPLTPVEHLSWKLEGHTDAPWFHGVAEIDSRFAAAWLQLRRNVKVGDQVFAANVGTDASTHPDFRKSGVYSTLRAFVLKEAPTLSFRFGRTHHAAIHRILKNEKERDPDSLRNLGNDIKILDERHRPCPAGAVRKSGYVPEKEQAHTGTGLSSHEGNGPAPVQAFFTALLLDH